MRTSTYFSQKLWPNSLLREVDDELFARKIWERVADIRAEFQTFSRFWSYCKALGKGAQRIGNVTVKDEERVLVNC